MRYLVVAIACFSVMVLVVLGLRIQAERAESARWRIRAEGAERVLAERGEYRGANFAPGESCWMQLFNAMKMTGMSASFRPRADGHCYAADVPEARGWPQNPAPPRR